ncbi:MAG: hypothetical protein ACO1QB_09280 [Verrucomicrobiales bacterium]
MKNKFANLRIYKAIVKLQETLGRFPTPLEIRKEAGISQTGAGYYLIRFFEHKLGVMRPVREYNHRPITQSAPRAAAG